MVSEESLSSRGMESSEGEPRSVVTRGSVLVRGEEMVGSGGHEHVRHRRSLQTVLHLSSNGGHYLKGRRSLGRTRSHTLWWRGVDVDVESRGPPSAPETPPILGE